MKLYKFKIIEGNTIKINGWTGTHPVLHIGDAEGYRYYSMPEGVDYEIDEELSFSEVDIEEEATAIKTLQVYKDINESVSSAIRAVYSLEDELKALRTQDEAYTAFVNKSVEEGKVKKRSYGLIA